MSGRIALKGVSKSFGEITIIPTLDLEIEDGAFVVFVGPSGCGKSTLLRLIAGLEDATAGRIEIDGVNVSHVPPAKRGLSMVFQSYEQARGKGGELKLRLSSQLRIASVWYLCGTFARLVYAHLRLWL